MLKSQKNEDKLTHSNTWLITYADLITLLLVFFVLLLASSTFDQSKYETLVESIQESKLGKKNFTSPFETLQQKLNATISKKNLTEKINIERTPLGLTIALTDQSLFESGQASLKPSAHTIIQSIADAILVMSAQGYELEVEIEGHTDDVPIHNAEFSSNWELSVFRAIDVLNRLIFYNIDTNQLKIAGYGDSRPKVPNRDTNGQPIPKNQAKNRRIEIKILRKDKRLTLNEKENL